MILAIDVGGTSIKYAIYDGEGKQGAHYEIPTPLIDYDAFLDCIHTLYSSMSDIEGIAISMPGWLDSEQGYVKSGGALGFNASHYVKHDIEALCKVPVSIQNDGKCAALAELWKGTLQDSQNGIVFLIGTGIGGGIIINHKLYVGSHAFAGELSFVMDISAPGFDHCLGSSCSVYALLHAYQAQAGLRDAVDGRYFFQQVREQDEIAIKVLHEYCKKIATAFMNLQAIYDPQCIAIGGGISAEAILLDTIKEELQLVYKSFPFPVPQAKITTCAYHNDANLVGALYQFLQQEHRI